MLFFFATLLFCPQVVKSVRREWGMEPPVGLVWLNRYITYDVITYSFMVWYDVYNPQHPEPPRFVHIPPPHISS